MSNNGGMNRRAFLATSAMVSGVAVMPRLARADERDISLLADSADPVVASVPAQWAASELVQTLKEAGTTARNFERFEQAPLDDMRILLAGPGNTSGHGLLHQIGVVPPSGPEALAPALSR